MTHHHHRNQLFYYYYYQRLIALIICTIKIKINFFSSILFFSYAFMNYSNAKEENSIISVNIHANTYSKTNDEMKHTYLFKM
jgi:hypothetical protein